MAKDPVDPGTRELPLRGGLAGVVGYVYDQGGNNERDQEALQRAGCERIVIDTGRGRSGLRAVVTEPELGAIVVASLSALGTTPAALIGSMAMILRRRVRFIALAEAVDSETVAGREFMRAVEMLLQALRGRQSETMLERKAGRRPVVTPGRLKRALVFLEKGLSVREAAAKIGVGKSALYEALKQENLHA